jgi:ribonuclease inhibitor
MSHGPVVDLANVSSVEELHALLASTLGFPVWYGKNWDAFWDCISDPQLSELGSRVILRGFNFLEASFPSAAANLSACLSDLPSVRPEVEVAFE